MFNKKIHGVDVPPFTGEGELWIALAEDGTQFLRCWRYMYGTKTPLWHKGFYYHWEAGKEKWRKIKLIKKADDVPEEKVPIITCYGWIRQFETDDSKATQIARRISRVYGFGWNADEEWPDPADPKSMKKFSTKIFGEIGS